MSASKGGHIIHGKRKLGLGRFHRDLEELGMRQLFDEESNSFSYLIWDKSSDDAVIIDPVQSQVARDLIVSTNLHLHYAINTHVHEDHISGNGTNILAWCPDCREYRCRGYIATDGSRLFVCEERTRDDVEQEQGVLLTAQNISYADCQCRICTATYKSRYKKNSTATEGMHVELWEMMENEELRTRLTYSGGARDGKLNWTGICQEILGQGGIDSWKSLYERKYPDAVKRKKTLVGTLNSTYSTPSTLKTIPISREKCSQCREGNCMFAEQPVTSLETCNQYHAHGGLLTRSLPSGAQADCYIQNGDQIHFGNRHIVALATPGHTGGCMSFLLDDGKAVITGDLLLADGYGPVLEQSGSTWSFCDSLFHKLFILPDDCVVLPGHDYGGGLYSTIGKEKALLEHCGNTMEDFVNCMNRKVYPHTPILKKSNVMIACNMKDGAKPFHVRALRASPKQRWGIFG